jgi:hypothetical protein
VIFIIREADRGVQSSGLFEQVREGRDCDAIGTKQLADQGILQYFRNCHLTHGLSSVNKAGCCNRPPKIKLECKRPMSRAWQESGGELPTSVRTWKVRIRPGWRRLEGIFALNCEDSDPAYLLSS